MLKSHRKTILQTLGRGPIHPFPARMAPGIALDALRESERSLRVLDPMVGSGTVLAVARANGHKTIGVDIDPLAVLLTRVWTRTIDAARVLEKGEEVLVRARNVFRTMTVGDAYPYGADEETRKFIRYWFDPYSRRQLTALSSVIRRVQDEKTREALWCGFSKLIISKQAGASLAMDLSHSRPHKAFSTAPVKPFNGFLRSIENVVANCPQSIHGAVGPASRVKCGDARALDISDASVDLILTSPPYLNAIDYMRCSKFSLVWMGYALRELRIIRGESVGTESASRDAVSSDWVKSVIGGLDLRPALSGRDNALLATYAFDIGRALSEAARVLKRGGRAVYVVGDSTVRGTFIRNSEIVVAAAEAVGLSLVSKQTRALPANRRYLPPPKKGDGESMNLRMRREVVLQFGKA